MKFLWTALILATTSGCVSVGDTNGREIGFDSYLAKERRGHAPLYETPAPVQTAATAQPDARAPTKKTPNTAIPANRVIASYGIPSADYDKIERASKSSFSYGSTQKGRIIHVANKTWVLKFVEVRGYDFAVIKPKGFKSQGRTSRAIVPDLIAATLRETSCNVSESYVQRTYNNGGPTQYSFHLMC